MLCKCTNSLPVLVNSCRLFKSVWRALRFWACCDKDCKSYSNYIFMNKQEKHCVTCHQLQIFSVHSVELWMHHSTPPVFWCPDQPQQSWDEGLPVGITQQSLLGFVRSCCPLPLFQDVSSLFLFSFGHLHSRHDSQPCTACSPDFVHSYIQIFTCNTRRNILRGPCLFCFVVRFGTSVKIKNYQFF